MLDVHHHVLRYNLQNLLQRGGITTNPDCLSTLQPVDSWATSQRIERVQEGIQLSLADIAYLFLCGQSTSLIETHDQDSSNSSTAVATPKLETKLLSHPRHGLR